MLQEITTQIFSLTPAASEAVKTSSPNAISRDTPCVCTWRAAVAAASTLGWRSITTSRDVDSTFESNGVKVVVDEVSIEYLRDATVDYVNDPVRGAGFAVNSPNAKEHGHSHGEGGCACGGSCSCNN
ncbi:MAG: hypothetical protein IPG44_06845 [Anaerolineales bacterium]|nr:hypothetical protein [Anaerolineales bacterium]